MSEWEAHRAELEAFEVQGWRFGEGSGSRRVFVAERTNKHGDTARLFGSSVAELVKHVSSMWSKTHERKPHV